MTRPGALLFLTAAAALMGCAEVSPPPPQPPPYGWSAPPPSWTASQPLPVAPAVWAQAPWQLGRASFYSDRLAGRPTATGEPYDPRAFTAAHRTLPLGSLVHVSRPDGRQVVVRINDRGPYARGRILDLSRRAAAEIGMVRDGVADVALRVLWVPPARRKRR